MTQVEDVLVAADLMELQDVSDRVEAVEWLEGRRLWPCATVMPVKRPHGKGIDVGYVRRAFGGAGPAEPVVFEDTGPVWLRRYTCIQQLVDAGWRCD